MSSFKVKRRRKTGFLLQTFPCQATALHEALTGIAEGSGDPRASDFTALGYLRDSILSRYTDSAPADAAVRAQLAVEKLLAAEKRNEITNLRFAELSRNPPTKFVQAVLNRARQTITEILGELSYDIFLRGGFSSGSSTSRLRANGSAASKYNGKGDVTLNAYPYISACQALSPLWEEAAWKAYTSEGTLSTRIVEGNVVFTVPKDNTIDRAAAKEPDYNMYLQRAVGNHVRKRLKKFGIDLNDQTVNQRLAQRGSIDGTLATLDLSAASDSVTTGLVQHLFPQSWTDLLFDLRSERGILPDSKVNEFHVWEMLSSMGNGFTFEIESLIFYSLCRSVAYVRGERGTISVYGDDLIVPSGIVSGVRRILQFCGFSLNVTKSYYNTPFRESCGKHYYNGADVTPFYIRQPIVDHLRMIHALNRIRAWGNIGGIADPRLFPIWEKFSSRIPKALYGGTDTESISALVSPYVEGGGNRLLPLLKPKSHVHEFSHYIASLAMPSKEEPEPDYLKHRIRDDILSRSSNTSERYKLVPSKDSDTHGIVLFPQEITGPVVASM